ncbi:MAG: hypothetical protein AB7F35_18185 [Acetobacteraceae bacterium]
MLPYWHHPVAILSTRHHQGAPGTPVDFVGWRLTLAPRTRSLRQLQ